MANGLLFDPPPKPRQALSDADVALKVARHLREWGNKHQGYEDDEIGDTEVDELSEALMATNSDDWKVVESWLDAHRPRSDWRWENQSALLEHRLKHSCEAVLPAHKRRQRFA